MQSSDVYEAKLLWSCRDWRRKRGKVVAFDGDDVAVDEVVGVGQELARRLRHVDAHGLRRRLHARRRVHRVSEEAVARHLQAHDAGHNCNPIRARSITAM